MRQDYLSNSGRPRLEPLDGKINMSLKKIDSTLEEAGGARSTAICTTEWVPFLFSYRLSVHREGTQIQSATTPSLRNTSLDPGQVIC
jgi:hypothetical protein